MLIHRKCVVVRLVRALAHVGKHVLLINMLNVQNKRYSSFRFAFAFFLRSRAAAVVYVHTASVLLHVVIIIYSYIRRALVARRQLLAHSLARIRHRPGCVALFLLLVHSFSRRSSLAKLMFIHTWLLAHPRAVNIAVSALCAHTHGRAALKRFMF